jgi:RNA polymerase-binding protein DksA
MSESKKLDDTKLEQYRKLLDKMKRQVESDVRQINDESTSNSDMGDVSGHALHMADVATDMYDREFNMSLASNDREILLKIDDAFKRIDAGEYGFCVECSKSIPSARLKAIPYTETCLKCQEEIERREGR